MSCFTQCIFINSDPGEPSPFSPPLPVSEYSSWISNCWKKSNSHNEKYGVAQNVYQIREQLKINATPILVAGRYSDDLAVFLLDMLPDTAEIYLVEPRRVVA